MADNLAPAILSIVIAAPGLLILCWAGATLFMWTYNRQAELPFEKDASDQVRLIRAGVDIIYGLLPVVAGVVFQIYQFAAPARVSMRAFWIVWVGAIVYAVLYYRFVRPALTRALLARRDRSSSNKEPTAAE